MSVRQTETEREPRSSSRSATLIAGGTLRNSGYTAQGQNGEIEIGLRYRGEALIPTEPQRAISGCSRVLPDVLALSLVEEDVILFVEISSGRLLRARRIPSPEALWSRGDGRLLVARPRTRSFTQVDLSADRWDEVVCDGMRPCHAALWGQTVLIVDQECASVWLMDGRASATKIPIDLHLLVPRAAIPASDQSFILCDRDAHIVVRVARSGAILWQYGAYQNPSADMDRLANPEHVAALGAGQFAVSDMRNSRLVLLSREGNCVGTLGSTDSIGSADGSLWAPIACTASHQGIIVADAGNGRIVERRLNRRDRTLWGKPRVEACLFHHPRSCTPIQDDLLVANSYHNRVVRVTGHGTVVTSINTILNRKLFWPRSTAYISDQIFFSDSRNMRVVRVDGVQSHEFNLWNDRGSIPYKDPHSIRSAGDYLLLTDSDNASVYLATRAGRLMYMWGPTIAPGCPGYEIDLLDVHDAVFDGKAGIWICDTGNNRLVHVGAGPLTGHPDSAGVRRTIAGIGLSAPRSIQVLPDGDLLVCDSDNHRVIVLDGNGVVKFSYGGRNGHALGHLAHPRHALIDRGRLFIADCINNRILNLPLKSLRSPRNSDSYFDKSDRFCGLA